MKYVGQICNLPDECGRSQICPTTVSLTVIPSNSYYMLVTSLPYMPRTFEVEQVPISRMRLEQRLTMLKPNDMSVVEQVQEFLRWDRQHRDQTDEDVKDHFELLVATITNRLVRKIIVFRMDVRTIVSGLRRRHVNMSPPIGVSHLVPHIEKHWDHPQFNLVREHPWIDELLKCLAEGNTLQAERTLMRATWNRWTQLAERYYFTFESVILYLVRWEIVDRWTRLNRSVGQARFEDLVAGALGEHASIYS